MAEGIMTESGQINQGVSGKTEECKSILTEKVSLVKVF